MGCESSPHGNKARLVAEHFDARTPAIDPTDFERCVQVQAAELAAFQSDVLVGSSFGGAVVVAMLERGLWRGRCLLLAQASGLYLSNPRLPEGIRVLLVHAREDEIVDIAHSRELALSGTPGLVELLEVDDDHGLTQFRLSGELVAAVRRVAGC